MKSEPFVIERTFNASIEKVWKAITDKNEMKKWYFDLAEFKPEVGFEFNFYGGSPEKQWLHLCKITEVIEKQKLTYSWKYEGYTGISFVTFELFAEENKTRLKLTHAGLESFPSDTIPELKKENFVMGWTDLIGRSLKEYLESSAK
ncbi:MAG: SRPBCC domain-containing protein [Bacteroidota bacterium]